jgi:hypothetical protein
MFRVATGGQLAEDVACSCNAAGALIKLACCCIMAVEPFRVVPGPKLTGKASWEGGNTYLRGIQLIPMLQWHVQCSLGALQYRRGPLLRGARMHRSDEG